MISLFKKQKFKKAQMLCRLLAIENDGAFRKQIDLWSEQTSWPNRTPPDRSGFNMESAGIVRLYGAAIPIAIIKNIESKSESRLIEYSLNNYTKWAHDSYEVILPVDTAKHILLNHVALIYKGIIEEPEESLHKLTDLWFMAVSECWQDDSFDQSLRGLRYEEIFHTQHAQILYAAEHLG